MLITLFSEVIRMSLIAVPIVLIVLIARAIMQFVGLPKILSYVLWAAVLFRFLCPFSFEAPFSAINEEVASGEIIERYADVPLGNVDVYDNTSQEFKAAVEEGIKPVISYDNTTGEYGAHIVTEKNEMKAAPTIDNTLLPILSYIWIFGICILIFYSIITFVQLQKQLVGAVPIKNNIYLADHIDSPFVLGIWKAKIYLPSTLNDREREYIILHEQHHIQRKDHLIKLLAFVALCIHWMNPLAWVSFILSAKDMEMSCDEAVLRKMGEEIREEYSASLLSLATGRRIIAGTPLAFGEGNTKSRIKNVLGWSKPVLVLSIIGGLVSICILGYCLLNPIINEPETSIHEWTSTISAKDIKSCAGIMLNTNDSSARIDLLEYPHFMEKLVNILNGIEKEDIISSNELNYTDSDIDIVIKVNDNEYDDYILRYSNGVTGFYLNYENKYNPGDAKQWQTCDVKLANFIDRIITVIESYATGPIVATYNSSSFEDLYDEWIMVTYYELSDGTWKTDEYNYANRFVLTGKTGNGYTTYTVLSNKENITFDQAFMASGFSSNMNDYFDPKDSVIVSSQFSLSIPDSVPEEVLFSGTFANIMGFSGYHTTVETSPHFYTHSFYTLINNNPVCIGKTFGPSATCRYYVDDINHDGVTELICNDTSGDGVYKTTIFYRNGNQILSGSCSDLIDVEVDNAGYASIHCEYRPDTKDVKILYADEDMAAGYGTKIYDIELDKINFEAYNEF